MMKQKKFYYSALSSYDYAMADLLVAKINLKSCSLSSVYEGIVDKIIFPPGGWSHVDYPVLKVKTMVPVAINLDLNRTLTRRIYKKSPVKLFTSDSDTPAGTVTDFERLTDQGILFLADKLYYSNQ